MASRRNIPPTFDDRIIQAPGMARRGPLPMEPLPSLALLENKLASQAVEIDQLAGDNHKLASSHISLRQDLVAAHREVEKLREHIRSFQTEGDIQIRILLDKIAKMEADIRAGENIKKELQEAHLEAQSLMKAKMELTAQIQQAIKELDNARADVKKLPEMHSELDSLRQEHQRLRKTFEYEKGFNIKKVEQMKIMEKDLVGMAGELERLRAEVLNAEKRASAPSPYNTCHISSDYMIPTPFHGNGGYVDSFGRSHPHMVGVVGEGMNPFASSRFAAGPPVVSGPAVGGAGGNPVWGGTYDSSHIQM